MEELSQTQKDVYNTYITNGIDKDDAEGLVRGTLSQDVFFAKLDAKEKPKDISSQLEVEGYDTKLIEKTGKVIKDKIDQSEYLRSLDVDSAFNTYGPTQENVFNFSGIRTDSEKELPGSLRFDLSFGLPNPEYKVREAKKLYKKYLVEEKGFKPEDIEKYNDKIEFKLEKVGTGQDQYDALIYRTPKELGGDNIFYAANSPKVYPTLGDFKAITGDLIPVTGAVTGGTAGSFISPIVGTTLGSAAGTFTGEITKLYIGKYVLGLHDDIPDEEFDKMAMQSAALSASIDLVATPAFLGVAQAIKGSILTAPKEKLSKDTINKFIKAGGNLDSEFTKTLDDAKLILTKAGVEEKVANDYLAISVANAIPEAGIIEKGSKSDILYSQFLEKANKRVTAKEVERKVIKNLTGLDTIDTKAADDIIDNIGSNVKRIRQDEVAAANQSVKDAFNDLSKTKISFYKDPASSEIDKIGVTFNEINQTVKPQLGVLEEQIENAAKNNNIKITLEDKDSIKVLNNIIKKYSVDIKKELPDITKVKLSPKQLKAYNEQKSINDLVDLLNEYGQSDILKKQLNVLKKGLVNLDTMSFDEAVTWRSLIRNAERETTGDLKNAFTKVKGTFNTAIDDATQNNPGTRELVDQYDDLLFNYRGSFLEDLTKQFGYGDSSRVLKPLELVGNNRNAFMSFMNNTTEGLNNAEKLGNLINSKNINSNQQSRIKSSMYEFYYGKVFPEVAGETQGKLSHKEFINQFGDNYRLILGDKEFSKFANSQKSALDTYQKFIDNQIRIEKIVSDKLPTLNINKLEFKNANAIVDEIFQNGKKFDISGLIKQLNSVDKELVNDIKKVFLRKFLQGTSSDVTVPGLLYGYGGGGKYFGLNGRNLGKFLEENSKTVESIFGKDFLDAHRSLAKALDLIQSPSITTKEGAAGLTEAANKAGLFVDIFAGPLNHKRLILNRLGRIYDGFDLGGDSLALLRDYNRFTEAAKKSFLGGNYPRILDKLGESKNPQNKKLFSNFFKSINTPYVGLEISGPLKIAQNPLTTKEYLKSKLEDKQMPGETGVFTPVDEVIGSLIGTKGSTAPKWLAKNINPKVNKLVEMLVGGYKERRKSPDKEEFEKKLLK